MLGSGSFEVPAWVLGAVVIAYVATCGVALWAFRAWRRTLKASARGAAEEDFFALVPQHTAATGRCEADPGTPQAARAGALRSPDSDVSACFYEPEAEADLEAGGALGVEVAAVAGVGAVGYVCGHRQAASCCRAIVFDHRLCAKGAAEEPPRSAGLDAPGGTPRFGLLYLGDSDEDLCGPDELFGPAGSPHSPMKPDLGASCGGGAKLTAGAGGGPAEAGSDVERGDEPTAPADVVIEVSDDEAGGVVAREGDGGFASGSPACERGADRAPAGCDDEDEDALVLSERVEHPSVDSRRLSRLHGSEADCLVAQELEARRDDSKDDGGVGAESASGAGALVGDAGGDGGDAGEEDDDPPEVLGELAGGAATEAERRPAACAAAALSLSPASSDSEADARSCGGDSEELVVAAPVPRCMARRPPDGARKAFARRSQSGACGLAPRALCSF